MLLFGLGLIELLLCAVFIIALVVSTAFDRYGTEGPKWVVLFFGFLAAAWWTSDLWVLWGTPTGTQVALSEVIFSPIIWMPVGLYLAAGIGYAVFEFFFGIWRAARQYRERWESFISKRIPDISDIPYSAARDDIIAALEKSGFSNTSTTRELFCAVRDNAHWQAESNPLEYAHWNYIRKFAEGVAGIFDLNNSKAGFIQAKRTGIEIEPKILKWELTQWLSAWTLLWPAYGLSLIFGDLLTEFFRALSDLLVSLSGRIVRVLFAGVFKF